MASLNASSHDAPLWCLQVIRRDERTGAPTLLFRVHVDRGISWDMAQGFLKLALAPPSPAVAAAMDTAGAAAGAEGPALASPSLGSGDQGKSKQKLKIRMGGKLITANDSQPSAAGNSSQALPPQPSPLDAMSDSIPSAPSDMLIDPGCELQQMECQTRMDSLNMAAHDASLGQTNPGTTPIAHTSNPEQKPSSSAAPDGVTSSSADTAIAPIAQAQQSPAVNHFGVFHTLHHPEPTSQSLHSNLGCGSALEAVVADAPQASPSRPPAVEGAPGPPGVSGYYRPARGAVRGVLLALETQGKGQVAVYRPATGPAARPMRLTELQDK